VGASGECGAAFGGEEEEEVSRWGKRASAASWSSNGRVDPAGM
jgi:hypothetical protein